MTISPHPVGPGRFTSRPDAEEGPDVRDLVLDGRPVAARLYFAIRDELWRTATLVVDERTRDEKADGFDLRVRAHGRDLPVRVVVVVRARGRELEAEAMAVLDAAFRYCRIGFCLLLDAEGLAGGVEVGSSLGGDAARFAFPDAIVTRDQHDPATDAFHRPFDRLTWMTSAGDHVEARFAGEAFEFEDQRNWTDASYKAYSVAPPGGWPVDGAAGETIRQRVALRVDPSPHPAASPGTAHLEIGEPVGPMPPVAAYDGPVVPGAVRPAGGFQQLNADRPDLRAAGASAVELAVNGAVHAADRASVMDTTRMHGRILAQAKDLAGGIPVLLAPVGFAEEAGDWRDPAGRYSTVPPAGTISRRSTGAFGAAWILASVASAAPERPAALRYVAGGDPGTAAGETVRRLAALAGRPMLRIAIDPAGAPLSALAVADGDVVDLAVVNRNPEAVAVVLPGGEETTVPGYGIRWHRIPRRALRPAAP